MAINNVQKNKKAGPLGLVLALGTRALFPRFCVRCKQEGSLLCTSCEVEWNSGRISTQCPVCEKETVFGKTCDVCVQEKYPDGHLATYAYADSVARELICNWKYNFDITAWEVLRRMIVPELSLLKQCVAFYNIKCVSPIPLHERRARERGFDQSSLIAKFISDELGLTYVDILERVEETGKQAHRSTHERKLAMHENPFVVIPSAYVPKQILLIDDVWTTGATASAAIQQLRLAGAERIWMYTIAKG